MGIYVFNARLLEKLLIADAADDNSAHDFGKNMIPEAIDLLQVFAYPFTDVKTRAQNYWRDVGTVDAFYDANIELVHVRAGAEPVRRGMADLDLPAAPAAGQVRARRGRPARHGGQFHGLGRLHHLRRRGRPVAAVLQRARRGALAASSARWCCRTSRSARAAASSGAILDEGCEIPDGMQIGVDRGADAQRFHVTDNGVVLVTPDMLRRP